MPQLGHLYSTRCRRCGSASAPVKYFLWVKTIACTKCERSMDLFPGYLLSQNRRHPRNIFICAGCGELTETDDRSQPGDCGSCGQALLLEAPARSGRCACPACGTNNRYH